MLVAVFQNENGNKGKLMHLENVCVEYVVPFYKILVR